MGYTVVELQNISYCCWQYRKNVIRVSGKVSDICHPILTKFGVSRLISWESRTISSFTETRPVAAALIQTDRQTDMT